MKKLTFILFFFLITQGAYAMKITKIEPWEDKIIVEVEGYPHAKPTFDAKISPEDLEVALKEWKIKQDEVDAINLASRTAPPKDPTTVDSKLIDMIGKDIK